MKRSIKTGFTLIELIITLVIIALLFGTGYMYMSGYLPKQRLNTSANALAALLQKIQSRAQTKGGPYGVVFVGNPGNDDYYACGFKDDNGDFQASHNTSSSATACAVNSCNPVTCNEMTNEKWVKLKKGVKFLDCTNATINLLGSATPDAQNRVPDQIVFDIKGHAYARVTGGTVSTGMPNNFEIMLQSCDIGVREVEVNSSGLIEVVRMGKAGNITNASVPAGGEAGVDNGTFDCSDTSGCP